MKNILTIIFLHISFLVFSQGKDSYLTYTYDNAGNRIARQTIIINKTENNNKNNTSGINNSFGEGNITIYPNPTESLLNIQFNKEIKEETYLQLYDVNGKLLKTEKIKSINTFVNLSSYTAGIYILKIISGVNRAEFTVIKK